MCECCSNNAATHQGHVHISGIDSDDLLVRLKGSLGDLPGVANVELARDSLEAKILFDTRILDTQVLKDLLKKSGFTVL